MIIRILRDAEPQTSTVLAHHGYRIRLQRTPSDWTGFITRHRQKSVVILAPDQNCLIARAQTCVREPITAQTMDQSDCFQS
jgi:hypothetical protein